MKKLLALTLCAFLSVAAFAAPAPAVVIADPANTYVDGVNVGAAVDSIANHPTLISPLQNALSAYVAKVSTDASKATDKAQKDERKRADDAIKAARDAVAAEIAKLTARVAELEAQLAAASSPPPQPNN